LALIGGAMALANSSAISLPLVFIPNAGQSSSEILYMVQTPDVRAGFAKDSAVFQVDGAQVRVRFAGASPEAAPEGAETLGGRANFLIGADRSGWKTNLPVFAKVVYRNLYPGIDAVYAGAGQHLKSEFWVAPSADPGLIRMRYEGAASVRIGDDGALLVESAATVLREDPPEVFQIAEDGSRVALAASYRLLDDHTAGFELGPYDRARPLLIDPAITYATYLGGSGMGAVTGVAIDSAGNLYAAGWTEALNFPIFGAYQAVNRGGVDAFVVKLNAAGNGMFYATYIGGTGDDRAAGIAVDASGQAHVAGATGSSNFPLAAGIRNSMMGGKEGFAVKLNAAGSGLIYSTFLGGAGYDIATAVAVDAAGSAYYAGDTQSTDGLLMNATQATHGGRMDGFLVKLSAFGVLQFGTFLGGSNDEHIGGIAVDSSGHVHVAGGTDSPNFPVTAAVQGAIGGGQDAFVAKIRTTSPPTVLWSTFLGGASGSAAAPEQANGVALDANGNVYVTGVTSSANFPVSNGALSATYAGSRDVFLTKLSATGLTRVYSTYFGTLGFDWAHAAAVDGSGNAYVAGYTSSASFPSVGALQGVFGGLYDAFVIKVSAAGNSLLFSTLFGGSGADQASAVAVDSAGNIYVGGQTSSVDFPVRNALQVSNTGGNIGWLARFGEPPGPAPQPPVAESASLVIGAGYASTVTAVFSHPSGASAITSAAVLLGNSASPDFACHVVWDPAANVFRLSQDLASMGSTAVAPGGGSAQNNQCTLSGQGSSAALTGNTLTLTLQLTLTPGFPSSGSNVLFIRAAAGSADTGWVAKGGLPRPSADSVSPSAGSGASQNFTFAFSDTQNALNLTGLAMLFKSSLSFTNACYIVYDRLAGSIALLYDNASGSVSRPLNSSQTLQNSQCAVGTVTVTISGQSMLINAAITFKPAFNGPQNIYMYAAEIGQNTGWQQRGTFTAATGGAPQAVGVSPSGGGGSTALLSFTAADLAGSSFITGMAILIAPSFNLNNACYLNYDRAVGVVTVAYDTAANGSSPVVLGSNTVVANSQCALRGAGSSVSFGATTVTLTLDLNFRPAFAGTKNVYLLAAEPGVNSGWQLVGTWTVTAAAPTVDSVSPSSGSGGGDMFTVTVTDPGSAANISGISLLFTNAGPSNACWVYLDAVQGRIGLYSDDLSVLQFKPLGSSATLQNTRCAVGYSVRNVSGNSVSLTVYVLFKSPAFTGLKTIYGQGHTASLSSGWVPKGSWTVP
jgi:hypothetical protein